MDITFSEIVTTEVVEVHEQNRSSIKETFLLGPFSLNWIFGAAKLPGKSLHFALSLAHQARLSSRTTIKIQPAMNKRFGLDRFAYYRSLDYLTDSGLVEVVQRKRGETPTLKLIGVIPRGANWGGGQSYETI
jgi:hypothetical protein